MACWLRTPVALTEAHGSIPCIHIAIQKHQGLQFQGSNAPSDLCRDKACIWHTYTHADKTLTHKMIKTKNKQTKTLLNTKKMNHWKIEPRKKPKFWERQTVSVLAINSVPRLPAVIPGSILHRRWNLWAFLCPRTKEPQGPGEFLVLRLLSVAGL